MTVPGGAGPANRLVEPISAHVDRLSDSWRRVLQPVLESAVFQQLCAFVDERVRKGATVYPSTPFRALELTTPGDVRVVLLGQDPYHGPGQAQGLAFSVPRTQARPPSLRNIFTEVAACYGGRPQMFNNDLSRWAQQGVLLLNTLLTVEEGQAGSHAGRGWEAFTDTIIAYLAEESAPKVFMLWGSHAQSKRQLIPANSKHLVLMANHPSPLSAQRPPVPFLGCRHFAIANDWLARMQRPPIDWIGDPVPVS